MACCWIVDYCDGDNGTSEHVTSWEDPLYIVHSCMDDHPAARSKRPGLQHHHALCVDAVPVLRYVTTMPFMFTSLSLSVSSSTCVASVHILFKAIVILHVRVHTCIDYYTAL